MVSPSLERREQPTPGVPAIAELKASGTGNMSAIDRATLLRTVFNDKLFNQHAWEFLERLHILGTIFSNLALRSNRPEVIGEHDRILGRLPDMQATSYSGTTEENDIISVAIAQSSQKAGDPVRQATREHASGLLDIGSAQGIVPETMRDIPIAIVGAGPGGIITARTLIELGFRNITVFDPKGQYGGIWTQPNVRDASKNNPNQMTAFGHTLTRSTDAKPGTGQEVYDFLMRLVGEGGIRPLPSVTKAKVTRVDSRGDLQHTITYTEGGQQHVREFAIVVNAVGNGEPLPVSRPTHMVTDEESAKAAGTRWQKILTTEQIGKLRGSTVTFIGLGNSTAEMILQIRNINTARLAELNRNRGTNDQLKQLPRDEEIRFRILTHYSMDQLIPDNRGRSLVYRNLQRPNLTNLAGDLPSIRQAFVSALEDGSIFPDVTEWHIVEREGKKMIQIHYLTDAEDAPEGVIQELPLDQLFTLIGYGQSVQTLNALGVTVIQPDTRTIGQDWDGEVQKEPEAEGDIGVPIPGHFMVGAVRGGENDNVIPGILFDMPDTALGIIMRAAEWQMREGVPPQPVLRRPAPSVAYAEPDAEEERVPVAAGRRLVTVG